MKYELIKSDSIKVGTSTLYRVKYLKDIKRFNVKAGDVGGYIESESNLSQDGDCVVMEADGFMRTGRFMGTVKFMGTGRFLGTCS